MVRFTNIADNSALLTINEMKNVVGTFRDGTLKTTGTDIDRLLPPVSRFGGGGNRVAKKQGVIERLLSFFEKYLGLV